MEGYQWEGEREEWGGTVQGIRSINGKYKMDGGRLRIVWEMEKPNDLYVQPTHKHELRWGCWRVKGCRAEGQ